MHARFEQRIEEGTDEDRGQLPRSVAQPLGVDRRRVGRLLGQNTRAAGLFDVQVTADAKGAAQIAWKKVETWRAWAQLSEGSYVLRSNVSDWSDEDLWKAYIQLTEAEAAFRIHKSDLSLRPVWHQKEDRVLAHILVCFLAYRALEISGSALPTSRAGRRTATRGGRTRRTALDRRDLAHQRRPRTPHPLRHATDRPPENPARTPRLELPARLRPRQCSAKIRARSLRRKHLRQLLGKLG